ncbi:MAG: lysine--tRNA ligase [Aigarchaeota archaeon]|nr:lysine--tRNA ligase [Candidatus Calditenuis fumarioli]
MGAEGKRVIGRGTWIDMVAHRLIRRERELGRSLDLIRTESGFGASGIPHIGSMADAVRAYAVTLALRDMGYNSEMVLFCDDLDGLRKVPAGMPERLREELLRPVSHIEDPFGSYRSFAERMEEMLKSALDEAGIEYVFWSGREACRRGLMAEQARRILSQASRIGERIKEMTGQEKFTRVLPYFPICKGCGRIYTAEAYDFDPVRGKVRYRCVGVQLKSGWYPGCGYEGEADVSTDEGKLAWKVEFAARWAALDIRFEAYGKDIADSVRVNDWVSDEILGHPHPYHVRYEMFLDAVGRKISKSTGNVFTPQMWYRYASPQSLMLFLLKRGTRTRKVTPSAIPRMMEELDRLEEFYFRNRQSNDLKTAKLRGLYEYAHLLRVPDGPKRRVPYRLLLQLAQIAPQDRIEEFVLQRLQRYGYAVDEDARRRLYYAVNYLRDLGQREAAAPRVEVDPKVAEVMARVLEVIKSGAGPEEIQSAVFDVSRSMGVDPVVTFRTFYRVLLNRESGPRLGPYLHDLGAEYLERVLQPYLSVRPAG